MILTREMVNKNIKFHDHGSSHIPKTYDYDQLSSLVDAYKNLFLSKGGGPGRSVVIGTQARTEQVALVLACAELGMTVTIIGNPYPVIADPGSKDVKTVYTPGFISKNYKALLPVDYFVVCSVFCTDKFQVFKDTCRVTIELNKETLDFTPNNTILAKPDTVFLKCVSSTPNPSGAAKIIYHTHDFFSALIQRNSSMYYGNMGMLTNLAHGSSAATFFLPALVAQQVTDFNNYNIRPDNNIMDLVVYLKEYKLPQPNHMIVPYTFLLDEFFASNETLPECVIYTLGIIRKQWVSEIPNKVKDIISIFGSNETSGPTLINQATDADFAENTYKAIDDFYELILTDRNELEIKMPVYGTVISTKDKFFKNQNSKYEHGGKSNLYRVNDLEINQSLYQDMIDKQMNGELIVDTVKDRIYLAVWDQLVDESTVKRINEKMKQNSGGRHFISFYNKLNRADFVIDGRLNTDAIRVYFRDYGNSSGELKQ